MSNAVKGSPRFTKAKRLPVKAAIIGSLLFAVFDRIDVLINTHLIQHIYAKFDLLSDLFSISFRFLFGVIITYLPAWLFGSLLVRWLARDIQDQKFKRHVALLKGALIAAIAVMTVCAPILVLEYVQMQTRGHAAMLPQVERTIMAVMIAMGMGVWSTIQIEKVLREPAGNVQKE